MEAWDEASGANLLLISDLEGWRGTLMGMQWSGFRHMPPLFQETFGIFNASALTIAGVQAKGVHLTSLPQTYHLSLAGDKVKHIMWRLLNGELPSAHSPKVIIVHVGASDVTGLRLQPL